MILILALIGSCVAASYPQRGDDTAVRLTVENHFTGMGLVVVRVMCDGVQLQAIRGLSLNTTRSVALRRAAECSGGLHIDLTDVTGHRVHWRSQRIPVSAGDRLGLTMGSTLNLSSFYQR